MTWNGLDSDWVAPNVDVSTLSLASAPQLVGLYRKFGRLTVTLTFFKRTGTPLTIVVSGLLAAMTRDVSGSTPIATRVTTVPRLNGPAAARTGIESPNGAPPYGPVK